jgi:hypothetical protein
MRHVEPVKTSGRETIMDAEKPKDTKPRIVVVFKDQSELSEVEQYADSKGLSVKSFAKFAMKSYMDKYPRTLKGTR